MNKTCLIFAAALCIAMPVATAHAADTRVLRDTPSELFTKEDWNIFTSSYKQFLNEGKDGDTTAWSNPATTAKGELTLLKTFEQKGSTCRTLKVANQAKNRKATNNFTLCKQPDGDWKIGSTPPKKAAAKPKAQ
jgi:surface antigen